MQRRMTPKKLFNNPKLENIINMRQQIKNQM